MGLAARCASFPRPAAQGPRGVFNPAVDAASGEAQGSPARILASQGFHCLEWEEHMVKSVMHFSKTLTCSMLAAFSAASTSYAQISGPVRDFHRDLTLVQLGATRISGEGASSEYIVRVFFRNVSSSPVSFVRAGQQLRVSVPLVFEQTLPMRGEDFRRGFSAEPERARQRSRRSSHL